MADVSIYRVQNRRTEDSEGRLTVSANDLTRPEKRKVWCINFRNMQVETARLVGIDDRGEYIVVLDSLDDSAWAVPKENIFYDEHSADKALFVAQLKYE